jgi:oligoendopeptidase F
MKHITWNYKPLFEGDDDPMIESKRDLLEKKSYTFITKWKDRKDYLSNPLVLKQALDEYEEWKRYYGSEGDEGYYFWLRTSQDQNDPGLKAKFNKIEHFSKKIENDIQFFYLRIAKIPVSLHKKFLNYAGLREYKHYLDRKSVV